MSPLKIGTLVVSAALFISQNAWAELCTNRAGRVTWRNSCPRNEVSLNVNQTTTCAFGGACNVGDTGPGGGVVFYDAGSKQWWGRYLEVAPTNWFGTATDPKMIWCTLNPDLIYSFLPDVSTGTKDRRSTSVDIGLGARNTAQMGATCDSGPAIAAEGYRGGAKADWYLPSYNELSALKNSDASKTLSSSPYWSSTEDSGQKYNAMGLNIGGGSMATPDCPDSASSASVTQKGCFLSVRPIRAF